MANQSYREDKVRAKTTLMEILIHLWPHFMKQKLLFFATLGAIFAVAAAARLSVTLFGYAIDNGILQNDRHYILVIAGAYFLLEAGRTFMAFLHSYLFAKVGNRILYDIRNQVIGHIQSLPIEFFNKNPTGRIVTRITNDVVSLGELFTQGLISVFAALISMIAIIAAMATISVKMTLVTLAIAPPLVWIVSRISKRILLVLRESKAKLAAINAFVAENINGMKILQIYDRIPYNTKKFQDLSADYRQQQLKSVRLYALLWPSVSFFNAASVATAFYVGGILTLENAVSTGSMIAFILHTRAFMDPIHVILEKYQILQNSISGAERVFTLLEEPSEPAAGSQILSEKLKGEVEFRNLGFRYDTTLPKVLDNINLHIKAGESIALVGRTGSGKSTTISLLQRFYDPTEGELLIDGKAITDLARHDLRSRIGVVQQDTFMFRGTIAQNISLGHPSITREQIKDAAEKACLNEILERHAGGLDAKVEERGANLSFGERQLIAFARILAFDPDILVLDEATANIDSKSERLIQEATRRVREGRTSIIIAHRISTVLDCDKIVALDHGRIAEVGSHEELIKQGGLYYSLCRAQFKEGEPSDSSPLAIASTTTG